MNINILFIAVIALFVYLIMRGYNKGFLRIVVSFIGMIFIIAAVKRAAPYVSEYVINNTDAYTSVQEKITEKFKDANLKYDNSIPANQSLTIKSYDLPDVLKDNLLINNTKEMYQALLVDIFEEYVSAYLAKSAIKAMSFVVLFVVFAIAFRILLVFVDIISHIPIIHGVNQMAGACLGCLEALIIVWVFFFVVVMFVGNDTGSRLMAMIADSKFLTVLFNTNVLINVVV